MINITVWLRQSQSGHGTYDYFVEARKCKRFLLHISVIVARIIAGCEIWLSVDLSVDHRGYLNALRINYNTGDHFIMK